MSRIFLYLTLFTLPFSLQKVFLINEGDVITSVQPRIFLFEIFLILYCALYILEHLFYNKSSSKNKGENMFHVEHMVLGLLFFLSSVYVFLIEGQYFIFFIAFKWFIYFLSLFFIYSEIFVPRGTNMTKKERMFHVEQFIAKILKYVPRGTKLMVTLCFLGILFTFSKSVLITFVLFYTIVFFKCSTWNKFCGEFKRMFHVEQIYKNKKECSTWNNIKNVFILGIFLQLGIIFYQVLMQRSLGVFYLGESVLSPWINGVATIRAFSHEILRGYGTFLHPNIAAFFFFIVSLIYIVPRGTNITKKERMFHVEHSSERNEKKCVPRGTYLFGGILIFFFVLFFFQNIDSKTFIDQSILERKIQYLSIPYTHWPQMLIGNGLGSYSELLMERFSSRPLWQNQPLHNTFGLFLFEVGILPGGILLFVLGRRLLLFRRKQRGDSRKVFDALLFSFFVLLNIDHYVWDLEQSRFIALFCLMVLYGFFVSHTQKEKMSYNKRKNESQNFYSNFV